MQVLTQTQQTVNKINQMMNSEHILTTIPGEVYYPLLKEWMDLENQLSQIDLALQTLGSKLKHEKEMRTLAENAKETYFNQLVYHKIVE